MTEDAQPAQPATPPKRRGRPPKSATAATSPATPAQPPKPRGPVWTPEAEAALADNGVATSGPVAAALRQYAATTFAEGATVTAASVERAISFMQGVRRGR